MPLPNPPFQNDVAKCAFAAFPTIARDGLLEIRHLNFAVAEAENVGAFEESLKCGQPAYLTSERKSPTPPAAGGAKDWRLCTVRTLPVATDRRRPDGL